MVRNNIELDVKVKCLETSTTQQSLAEKNRYDRSVCEQNRQEEGRSREQDLR